MAGIAGKYVVRPKGGVGREIEDARAGALQRQPVARTRTGEGKTDHHQRDSERRDGSEAELERDREVLGKILEEERDAEEHDDDADARQRVAAGEPGPQRIRRRLREYRRRRGVGGGCRTRGTHGGLCSRAGSESSGGGASKAGAAKPVRRMRGGNRDRPGSFGNSYRLFFARPGKRRGRSVLVLEPCHPPFEFLDASRKRRIDVCCSDAGSRQPRRPSRRGVTECRGARRL